MTSPPAAYAGPMRPHAALAPHARTVSLEARGDIFVADTHPGAADRPTVFLLHGLQDDADTWRHLIGPLAAQYRVIAPDLPGFGRSVKTGVRIGIGPYADVVDALVEKLAVDRFALVGSSLGGMVAEEVTLCSPARVWALVLLAGTLRLAAPPPSPIPLWTRVLQGARIDRDYFEGLRRGPAQACYDTLKPFYADLAGLPEADRRFLFQRVNERVWDEAQRLAALSVQAATLRFFLFNMARIRRGIARLPVPTLVAWGAADRIMPTANLQPRVDAQPGARGALLDGVGHLPQQEHPERLLDRLLPHLQRHAPSPEK